MSTALMYHELERPGRQLADRDPGYLRYVVHEEAFAQQLSWIREAGLRGVTLGQARTNRFAAPEHVVITFDDGCESDWVLAAPRLVSMGFGATIYVVSAWIGRRGFLTASQLREIAAAGFEVGSHSATHAFLPDLEDVALRRELLESRQTLEDILGRPVKHLSCPGGRANRRVARAAQDAGYDTMATSRVGANGPSTNPFDIARCAVRRDTSPHVFEAFCRGTGLGAIQIRDRALTAAKGLLGNKIYGSLRNATLNRFVGS